MRVIFDIDSNRAKRESVDAISFYKSFLTFSFIVISFLSISLNLINAYNKIIFFLFDVKMLNNARYNNN